MSDSTTDPKSEQDRNSEAKPKGIDPATGKIVRKRKLRKKRARKVYPPCVACREVFSFAWSCRKCDFVMCQSCMNDNLWGMTCNNITWTCPDCGWENSFGTR